MRFPDFFLVGAPKAGTTSIYAYFSRHPGIFVPKIKEPHFFSCPEVKDTYYEVPFIDTEPDYLKLFKGADEGQQTGDFSPSYLYYENAALRIKERCPDAKILMVLRDPVDRAISHYLMDLRDGYQDVELLECLMNHKDYPRHYREYVEVGKYSKPVKRYIDLFGRENVHVWLFDAFTSHTEETVCEMVKALGLDWDAKILQTAPKNRFQYYKYPFVKKIVFSNWAQWCLEAVPWRLKNGLKQIFLSDEKPDLSKESDALKRLFREDIEELEAILSKDLGHWLH